MKRKLIPVLALAALLGGARPAHAIFEIYGSGLTGGGGGIGGKEDDFFRHVKGGLFGFEVGAKILLIKPSIAFHQFYDGGGLTGRWFQFMLGGGFSLPLGGSKLRLDLSVAAGYGLGTTEPVQINRDTTTARGIVAEGGAFLCWYFNRFLSVDVGPEVAYHYLWKGAVNSEENSSGVNWRGLARLTLHLGI